jgi:trans-2,3-dihydro-3-hydroxyanthranilate isomerase
VTALAYEIVDVFTDRPFTGNPLAVVFGADGLDRSQMQTLAREFHLSETVFVLPPTQPGATYRARILPIDVEAGGRATLTGGQPTVSAPLDPVPLLDAVGLALDDYVGPQPRVAGCGLEFTYLSVRAEAVPLAHLTGAGAAVDGLSVFAWDPGHRTAHTRVFVPGAGVPEDPATGSAALGLGVWLVTSGLLPPDEESSYVVRQGVEIHRPSILECLLSAVDGRAAVVTVSGSVVPIASGTIAVPPFVG